MPRLLYFSCTIFLLLSGHNCREEKELHLATESSEKGGPGMSFEYADQNRAMCFSAGGKANDSGLKTWCWQDQSIPPYQGRKSNRLSNGELVIDSECSTEAVYIDNDKIHFQLNPLNPPTPTWCERDYNMRAEIRTAPWDVRNPLGTEEWIGWTYKFGEDYKVDKANQWVFFQIYPGPRGLGPHISLEVTHEKQFRNTPAGEIYITNKGAPDHLDYMPTGVVPKAGQTLEIVVHVVWGSQQKPGLLELWIDGKLRHRYKGGTTNPKAPWGGNAKFGIYKWPWAKDSGVQASLNQGIAELNTSMGNLRILTRFPDHPDYLSDSYVLVAPRNP